MTTPDTTPPAIIDKSHRAVLLLFYALLLVFTGYGLWQIPDGNLPAILLLWLIKALPLLIFVPSLHMRKLRAYAWLSFLVLLYFIQGVQTAFTEEARVYGVIVTLLLSGLFSALIVYIRSYRQFYKVSL